METKAVQMIEVPEHELIKILGSAFRYGMTRDNHLQPWASIEEIKKYIVKVQDSRIKGYWIQKFLDEIHFYKWDIENMTKSNQELLKEFTQFLQDMKQTVKEN